MKKILLSSVLLLISLVILTGCEKKEESIVTDDLGINFNVETNIVDDIGYDSDKPLVAMKIKNYGAIIIELYKEYAPNTVTNFMHLVSTGFYDNNTMHRMLPGFVLQGGDPTGTGSGGPSYSIKGEFINNKFLKNTLKHTEGIVSMARSKSNDSAGSQFFIMLGSAPHLDGAYAAFGKVVKGMEIVKKIEQNEKITDSESGKLVKNLTIEKALVVPNGEEIKEPVKVSEE